jgi:hypothetical protein
VTKTTARRWKLSQREAMTIANSDANIRLERITHIYTCNNNDDNYNVLYNMTGECSWPRIRQRNCKHY